MGADDELRIRAVRGGWRERLWESFMELLPGISETDETLSEENA